LIFKATEAINKTTPAIAMATNRGENPGAPRERIRKVASAAPPPRKADARAKICEMLVKEPTTSSGEGIAKADPVLPRQKTNAPATAADMHEKRLMARGPEVT
jgi:hypothetical protein